MRPLPHGCATYKGKQTKRDPGKQHPQVLNHLHPRETDMPKTPVAGHTGSPEMILPDTEHKADDHDDYDDEDDGPRHPAG